MSHQCRLLLLTPVLWSLLCLSPAAPGGAVDSSSDGRGPDRGIPSAHSEPCETPTDVSIELYILYNILWSAGGVLWTCFSVGVLGFFWGGGFLFAAGLLCGVFFFVWNV